MRLLQRRRAVRLLGLALLAAGVASGSLPLLDAPGYELGELGALLAVALAPLLAFPAVREERLRPLPSAIAAWAGAAATASLLLAALLAGALARAAAGPCAAVTPALGFFPLLALPSALVACAAATLAAFAARGRTGRAAILYAAFVIGSLALTLREGYVGPAAFLFDPLLGAWPGPLYDEALRVDARVVLFRLDAVALSIALVALAHGALRLRRAGHVRLRGALPALAVLALAAGALASLRAARDALLVSGERDVIARALGGRRDGPRCTLVHPSEKPAAAVSALLAECEFHVEDVARALGVEDPPRVTAYVYRTPAEKRKLVGAGATEYAKPWLGELHVADAPLPHPVLRHEIAHAVAASASPGALRVPARFGVLPSAGLIEGLAVAAEVPRSEWTVHEWSRAARDLGLLPDVARIVGPAGFWTQAPARAYTAAGSFLAFVAERHGREQVLRAYATADLGGAMGLPLEALVAEWQRFLDGVVVPDGLRTAAQARLGQKSLFARRCAREAATLQADAGAAAGAGRLLEACELWRRAAPLSPPGMAEKAIGDLLARAGDLDGAAAAYATSAARAPAGDRPLEVALLHAGGDLALRRGDLARAGAAWTGTLTTAPDRLETRQLHAKLLAASDPSLLAAAGPYLLGDGDPALALARVARRGHPLAAYLVGRALLSRGEARAAVAELAQAAGAGLPAVLDREARFLLGEARCLSGDPAAGERALRELLRGETTAADRERIEASLRRCAFERRSAGAP